MTGKFFLGRTSEDKVRRKDYCWSVRVVYVVESMAHALALDTRMWPREDVPSLGLTDEDVSLLRGEDVTSRSRA